jgi:hypothetical protein
MSHNVSSPRMYRNASHSSCNVPDFTSVVQMTKVLKGSRRNITVKTKGTLASDQIFGWGHSFYVQRTEFAAEKI